jgi:hypothetical protein
MADWIHAEYRDFDDIPRMMVCTNAQGTYLFQSRFDEAKDEYADTYEVYRIRPLSDSDACASWFGLETRALERLPDIPVGDFPFDVATRRFLPYDSIAPLLKTRTNR